jgi:hypothetical protein
MKAELWRKVRLVVHEVFILSYDFGMLSIRALLHSSLVEPAAKFKVLITAGSSFDGGKSFSRLMLNSYL